MDVTELNELVDGVTGYLLNAIVPLNNDETEYVVKAMQEKLDDWLNRLEAARSDR